MSQERRSPNQPTQLQNDQSPTDDPLPPRERIFSGNSSTRTHDEAIASLSMKCSQLFEQVQSSLSDRTCQDRSKLRPEDIEDQAVRFKLWAGNLGAFHKPQSHASIEHRVRQSPKIEAQLRELLDTLSTSLRSSGLDPGYYEYKAYNLKLFLLHWAIDRTDRLILKKATRLSIRMMKASK
jgi:hypothetical protein